MKKVRADTESAYIAESIYEYVFQLEINAASNLAQKANDDGRVLATMYHALSGSQDELDNLLCRADTLYSSGKYRRLFWNSFFKELKFLSRGGVP